MQFFSKIAKSTFLLTAPTLIAHPTYEIPKPVFLQVNHKSIQLPDLRTLSYDEVVDSLSKIESDSFEDTYSMDELDQINQFISFLAMEGVTDDKKIDMANATASLFQKNGIQYSVFDYSISPAIYTQGAQDIILCKSWSKKQWDQTRSFVKKHKKRSSRIFRAI